jgi:glycerol kinase
LGAPVRRLRVDGGAAANDLLMQIQSDIADITIERPTELEATARGAAMLAAVGAGIFPDLANAAQMVRVQSRFEPQLPRAARERERERWREAVQLARTRKA